MLHFAPEPFFREFFTRRFGQYETADLKRKGVDHKVDLQQLPFGDKTYDFVFASHVLEHIPDDHKAIFEIHRILKPNGMAILPVPIYSEKTIEYPEPNPHEFFHVRAPGTDYFDRYERYFQRWRGLVLVHCRRNTSYLFMKTMAICRKGITLGLLRCKGTSLAIGSPCVTYEL
jgi:SAM-dependent methyltransferase